VRHPGRPRPPAIRPQKSGRSPIQTGADMTPDQADAAFLIFAGLILALLGLYYWRRFR